MRYVEIPVSQLNFGMYVSELDRPWEETPFMFQGFRLEDPEDLDTLKKLCKQVTVDNDQSDFYTAQPKPAANKIKTKIKIADEMPVAERTFEATRKLIGKVMKDARIGKSIDIPETREAVNDMVASVERNPNAMSLLTRLRQKDAYTAEHSLSVSILSTSLGKSLGLPTKELRTLGLAGMLHDIGKVLSPDEVLLKEDKLTMEEMKIMKKHPVDGREILFSSQGVQDHSLAVAMGHHEKLDGSGYPIGAVGDAISEYTKIVSIVDTYDAVTSDRSYDKGRSNIEAFDILMAGRGSSWESNYVIKFIETIGIYPPGSIVKLSSDEIAVVVEHNPLYRLKPLLVVIQNPHDLENGMRMVDLADDQKDKGGKPIKIVKVMSHSNNAEFLDKLRRKGLFGNLPSID